MNQPVLPHIDGRWREAEGGRTLSIIDPATEETLGTVAHASLVEVDEAPSAADKGFKIWRDVAAFERSRTMRKAAEIFRSRSEIIASPLTQEQRKPIAEAPLEVLGADDVID